MNSLIKKIVVTSVIAVFAVVIGVGVTKANDMTLEELTAAITELQEQLDAYQDQLVVLTGEEAEEEAVAIEGVPADFTFETNLKKGTTSDDVKYLQIVLNSASDTQVAETSYGAPGEETTYFGPLTEAAVIIFQEKYADDVLASWGLTEGTGYVGSTTRAKLNELLAVVPEPEIPEGLTSVSPAADATGVALDVAIEAVFDVELDADTVNATSVGLVTDSTAVEGEVTYDADVKTITFTPSESLAYETEYAVTLTTDITADDEAVLDEDYSWSFTTEEAEVISGLSVALGADTPIAASVPTSTAVLFTNIDFTAGIEGDITVNAITVARTGLGADTDVGSVAIYDGSDRLSSTRSSFNSVHKMTFNISGGWTIPAGETKTLSIKADLDNTGTYNALGIAADTDISLAEGEVSGSFPIYGSQMTGLTVEIAKVTIEGESTGAQTKKIGTDNVLLTSFNLEVSSKEDVDFKSIILRNKGSVKDSDLANLYLKQAGTVLAGPVSMVRDYITFTLDEPYTIEKSDDVTFKVVGDIEGGDTDTVWFILKNETDIVCTGKTYGYGATVDSSGYDEQGETKVTTIQGAQLNINLVSSNLETPDEINNVVFGTLEMTASAEDVRISKLIVNINEYDGDSDGSNNLYVREVELVDTADGSAFGYTSVANRTDGAAQNEEYTFEDEIYLTEGVKRSLEIRGDLPKGIGNGDQYYVVIDATTADIEAEGVDSGDTIDDFSVAQLVGRRVTVKTAGLTILPSPLNPGDAVIDTTDVVLFGGTLSAGPGSDIRIDRMKFIASATNLFDVDNVSRAVLYTSEDEEAQVLTSSELSDGTADFSSLDIVVPAGSANAITFGVKVDIPHVLDADGDYRTLNVELDLVSARDEDNDRMPINGVLADNNSTGLDIGTARIITLHGVGTFKVAVNKTDTGVSRDRYTLADTVTDWIGKIKVRAENESVLIKDLTLTNLDTNANVSVNTISLYEEDKETPIGVTQILPTGVAVFDDINYTVEAGTEYIYIKADLRKIGTGASDTAKSEDYLQVYVNATSGTPAIFAEGADSGEALITATTTYGSASTTDRMIVYYDTNDGSYSTTSVISTTASTTQFIVVGARISAVDLVSSAGGKSIESSLSEGSNNVAILKVVTDTTTNTDDEEVLLKTLLKRIRVDISTNATITAMTIERIGGSGNEDTMTTSADYAYIASTDFTNSNDVKIDSGDTAYYLIRATFAAFGSSREYVKIDLDALDAGTNTANIHWNDGEATTDFKTLRLDYNSVDGTKILEPVT